MLIPLSTLFQGPSAFYPFPITNSLRLCRESGQYLSRTFGTGNRQRFSLSFWMKPTLVDTGLAGIPLLMGDAANRSEMFALDWTSQNLFTMRVNNTGDSLNVGRVRDMTGWYNVLWAVDTTLSDSALRSRLYLNGVEMAKTGTAPTLNTSAAYLNNGGTIQLFGCTSAGRYFDGYVAEVVFADGYQLTPSHVGQFIGNVWTPRSYTGNYGAQGFRLEFKNSGALGTDTSGNGNAWTPQGSPAQSLDTPTNNQCALNWLDTKLAVSSQKLAGLRGDGVTAYQNTRGTMRLFSGKWYWETVLLAGSYIMPGVADVNADLSEDYSPTVGSNVWGYASWNGNKYSYGNAGTAYGASYGTAGDTIGVAYDADNGTLEFFKNGTSQGVAFTGLPAGLCPWFSVYSSNAQMNVNPTTYSPPANFKRLAAQSMADGGKSLSGSYTGNGSTDGPFVNTGCCCTAVTIAGTTYTKGGNAAGVVDFCAAGFKLRTSSAPNASGTSYSWSIAAGNVVAEAKYANAQTN